MFKYISRHWDRPDLGGIPSLDRVGICRLILKEVFVTVPEPVAVSVGANPLF